MLEKHRMLVDGLRGELVVRRNATYEIDPLTRRINRWVLIRLGSSCDFASDHLSAFCRLDAGVIWRPFRTRATGAAGAWSTTTRAR